MTEAQTNQSIIDFIENWRTTKGIIGNSVLTESQLIQFSLELQSQLSKIDILPSDPNSRLIFSPNAKPIPQHWGQTTVKPY